MAATTVDAIGIVSKNRIFGKILSLKASPANEAKFIKVPPKIVAVTKVLSNCFASQSSAN